MPTTTEINALAKRMLANQESGTTDMAADVHRIPVSRYTDRGRWDEEIEKIYKRVPLALGVTAELREPGQYKALDAAEIPVLLVRQNDGSVRGFLNACRHRGAPVAELGTGKVRRFTCPYHAWSYDRTGALVGLAQENTFGEVDKCALGLTEIPVAERLGLIFGVLTPGVELDVDEWLGGFADELESLRLAERHVFSTRELTAANWKLIYDGYLEGYHFAALHTNTINNINFSNLMGIDAWGPHQRVAFARRTLVELRDKPEDEWEAEKHIGVVTSLFPNVAISSTYNGGSEFAMVSTLFPGAEVGTSRTVQTLLTLNPVDTEERREAAQYMSDFYYKAVSEEDYWMNERIQKGMLSGANAEFVFGRNELGLHHFHKWVDRLVEA